MAAAFLAFFFGVRHCAKTVQNVTRNAELKPKPLPKDPLDEPPGVVGLDGVLIHARKKAKWLEMKVASFYSHVEEVSPDRRQIFDASFVAGAMKEWEDFQEPVTQEAFRRGLDGTEAIQFLGDGGEGIWTLQ